MTKRRTPLPPTGPEGLADSLIQLASGKLFTLTASFEDVHWRGKTISRASLKNQTGGMKLPRKIEAVIKKVGRALNEKVARQLLRQRKRQLKAEGMRASVAEDRAVKEISSMFGIGKTTLRHWATGKADAKRRKAAAKPKSSRRRRAKNTP